MTSRVTTQSIHVVLKMPKKIGDFIIGAQKIHDTMAANAATLKAPSPSLAVLQTDIDTLITKQALAKTRTAGAVAERDAAKKVVNNDLNGERGYVETLANADPMNAATIAGDAGMTVRKPAARNKPLLAAKQGTTTGQVHVVAKATKGAKVNGWQYSVDGGKTWIDAPETSKASTTLQGLAPTVHVMFRQRVFTKAIGWSNWSEPVSLIVQ
jgi:hypothetical protein